ncbi:flagellar hook-length control protein FliK [Lysinibacillus endophyticus]|uniref:flagellar hook-length control protein FliK n=1 Tax=Ureibacillus endophyticus TaxID=1978490 RepID=UPI00209CD5F1|nr:flagellar hook-length control protein FliK [Lysinibacillus endophyticus]MCP1144047.1 flagellar hook-length control protein FliK [Lysinibacillus endophyticus]
MNVGILQLSNISTNAQSSTISKQPSNSDNFGDIFSQIANKEEVLQKNPANEEFVNLEKLEDLLNSSTIEEVLSKLDISYQDGMVFNETLISDEMNSNNLEKLLEEIGQDKGLHRKSVSENIETLEINEMLNIDNLLNVLQINYEEIINAFEELFGADQIILSEVWDLIHIVDNQPQELTSNSFIKGLNGDQNLSPQTVQQILHVLKVIETVGSNSNLSIEQQNQIVKLKEILQVISKDLEVKNNQNKNNNDNNLFFNKVINSTINIVKQNEVLFSQNQTKSNTEKMIITSTVQQMEVTNEQNEENTSNVITPSSSTMISSKTFTITLPVEKSAQSDAFVKEFQSLLNRTQLSNSQGTMKLLVKLYPENLGSIRIEILQKDGVLTARLLASTSQAKELLDSQIQQLKTTFAQQNIQMDRIDIAQSLQEIDRNLRDQNLFGNMFKQQQSEQEDDDEQEENTQDDSMSFEDYLLNEEV